KEALGFRALAPVALDVTGDRDFVAEVLFALALVGSHLSRLAAELQTYASAEYGFVKLSDAFSTGSSLMPQKRNPDVLELARAKSARLLGDLVALLATLKGIPAVAAFIRPALGAALAQLGTWEDSIEGRATPGGSARQSVAQQLEELRKAFTLGGAG